MRLKRHGADRSGNDMFHHPAFPVCAPKPCCFLHRIRRPANRVADKTADVTRRPDRANLPWRCLQILRSHIRWAQSRPETVSTFDLKTVQLAGRLLSPSITMSRGLHRAINRYNRVGITAPEVNSPTEPVPPGADARHNPHGEGNFLKPRNVSVVIEVYG